MARRPGPVPLWATDPAVGAIVEPTAQYLAAGYPTDGRPPAQWANFHQTMNGEWIDFLRGPNLGQWGRVSPATYSYVTLSIVFSGASDVPAGSVFTASPTPGQPANRWITIVDLSVSGSGTHTVIARASVPGMAIAAANTITVAEGSLANVSSINNPSPAIEGAAEYAKVQALHADNDNPDYTTFPPIRRLLAIVSDATSVATLGTRVLASEHGEVWTDITGTGAMTLTGAGVATCIGHTFGGSLAPAWYVGAGTILGGAGAVYATGPSVGAILGVTSSTSQADNFAWSSPSAWTACTIPSALSAQDIQGRLRRDDRHRRGDRGRGFE